MSTKQKPRNHGRAPGQTSISASVPASIKARLTALAEADHRTLSNYLAIHFARILGEADKKLEAKSDNLEKRAKAKVKKSVGQPAEGNDGSHSAQYI
jgi:hypothetical protein